MSERLRSVSTATGVFAPAAILLTIAAGAASSPTYDWPTDPFSVLGAPGEPTAAWFGAGLSVGGLLALPFAVRLWRDHLWRNWSAPVGGLYALVGLAFVGAGLFPLGSVWHEVFGAGVLFGIWLHLWVAAVADWRTDSHREGVYSFLLGTAALVVWLPYDVGVERAQLGYGFAELVSLFAFAGWSAWTAVRLQRAREYRPATDANPDEVPR